MQTMDICTFRKLTALLVLMTLSVMPSNAETLTFGSSSTYAGKKVELTGRFAAPPSNKKSPLVILMHGCGGLGSAVLNSLQSHAEALQSFGFATFILDSFNPRAISGGWVCKRDSRMASAQAYQQRDVADAVNFLIKNRPIDPQNIFVMGQSNGGTTAVLIARNRRIPGLRAVVAYYPWCVIVGNGSITPLLIFGGEKDDWTPPDNCEANNNPAKGLSVVTYADAVHSFDLNIAVQNYQGHLVGGNRAATLDSRRRMITFFKSHLK